MDQLILAYDISLRRNQMEGSKYDKGILWGHVERLPERINKQLPLNIILAFSAVSGFDNTFKLVNACSAERTVNIIPDPEIDLYHTSQFLRKIVDLKHNDSMIPILNEWLKGGPDYPIMKGVCGIIAGIANPLAGILFKVASIALQTNPEPFLARDGDEIWQYEQVGVENNDFKFVNSFLLVDPYRKIHKGFESSWVIHQEFMDLKLN
jgi:hypothetical protein